MANGTLNAIDLTMCDPNIAHKCSIISELHDNDFPILIKIHNI